MRIPNRELRVLIEETPDPRNRERPGEEHVDSNHAHSSREISHIVLMNTAKDTGLSVSVSEYRFMDGPIACHTLESLEPRRALCCITPVEVYCEIVG